METSDQKDFMLRIKKALGHPSDDRQRKADLFDLPMSEEDQDVLQGIRDRTATQKNKLLTALIEAAKPINLNVTALADESAVAAAIAELVEQKEPEWGGQKSVVSWEHSLIERLNLAEGLESLNVPVYFIEAGDADGQQDLPLENRKQFRQQVIGSYIGLTSANFCIRGPEPRGGGDPAPGFSSRRTGPLFRERQGLPIPDGQQPFRDDGASVVHLP